MDRWMTAVHALKPGSRRVASTAAEMDARTAAFLEWLRVNGSVFPKIDFPRDDTPSGIRGAVALQDIDTGEHVLKIPIRLMMSPEQAFADGAIGACLEENRHLLRGDLLLALYIMYEYLKGEASFYQPYLAILPQPGTVSEWTSEQLLELQDDDMTLKARRKSAQVQSYYTRSIVPLCQKNASLFPIERYTFELFAFAWHTVQARAFGRRLPWTALVPFADCLNHSNVQTKYDYNVDDNGYFRLFPTGSNSYSRGTEVFNSYGRRHNENLLLDYGFSMLHNMWDTVPLPLDLTVSDKSALHSKKVALIVAAGYSAQGSDFKLHGGCSLPMDALTFLRIASLNDADYEMIEVSGALVRSDRKSLTFDDMGGLRGGPPSAGGRRSLAARCRSIVSIRNECAALDLLSTALLRLRQNRATTIEHDTSLLQAMDSQAGEAAASSEGGETCGDRWRLRSALVYRITRKALVDSLLERISLLNLWFAALSSDQSSLKGVDTSPLKHRIRELFGIGADGSVVSDSKAPFVVNYINECFRIGKKGCDLFDS